MCNILVYKKGVKLDKRMFHYYPRGIFYKHWENKNWMFEFMRLPFVGYESSPYTKDGNIVIMFNGEIYNHRNLTSFSSELDALHYLYARDKKSLFYLHLLKGEFVYVIYDASYPRFILYRSKPGVVPFYYSKNVLSTYRLTKRQKVLQPGVYTILYPDKIKKIIKPYEAGFYTPDLDYFKSILEDTLISYVLHDTIPLFFVSYSGGLDSSIILYLLRQFQPTAISVAYKNTIESEFLSKVKPILKEHGIKLEIVYLDFDKVKEAYCNMHPLIDVQNPVKFRGAVRNYWVAKKAHYLAEGPVAVVGGEGADELFGGYPFFNTQDRLLRKKLQAQAIHSMQSINLDRTNLVPYLFNVEWRVPFLEQRIIQYALIHDVVYPNKEFLWKFKDKFIKLPVLKNKYNDEEKITTQYLDKLKKEVKCF